ncbi:galactose mutarotase [Cereibacter sphaeroides]|nr:galactose mutarotase [Cereibacter sphaeroides]
MDKAVLEDGAVRVSVLGYGARVQDWRLPCGGTEVSAVLGHAEAEAYRRDPFFLGAIVGRVANRIGGARYRQNDQTVILQANDGANQLHGGAGGLYAVDWRIDTDGPRRLLLSHHSPDGAMGFPGAVDFEVEMTLTGHRLTWDMRARVDRKTPISLAQHNYYRLGGGKITARIDAPERLQRDAEGIMTGTRLPAAPFDLRTPAPLPNDADDFLLFDPARDPEAPVAEFHAEGGLRLRMWSDQLGAQLYSGHGLGAPFAPRDGFCLEPSGLPNAVNRPEFPTMMCSPDRPYRQVLSVEITDG